MILDAKNMVDGARIIAMRLDVAWGVCPPPSPQPRIKSHEAAPPSFKHDGLNTKGDTNGKETSTKTNIRRTGVGST